ncbi:MAG: ATP-binding cassette domain-containing protein [Fimbriimonadaceae bacterium]|nr:ATP-binding cassette domain-containing protein [Fimbriimonadaceae bacterium]
MSDVLLTVEDLRVTYRGRDDGAPLRAVDGVSFELRAGQTLGLVGESGCGKSTTGRAILRLVRAAGGACRFAGDDVLRFDARRLRAFRSEAQIVFQDPFSSLNPRFTVLQTLAEPLLLHRRCGRSGVRVRVAQLLERVGLDPVWLHRYPHEFSGGQRQRLGIARALAVEPRLIVCDEPLSALDVTVQARIVNLFQDLQRDLGVAYLFISHDLSVVRHLSHEVAVMYLGRLVEQGPAAAVYQDPQHPYTRALLAAVPVPDPAVRRERLPLGGDVPSAAAMPPGCRFHPRCPLATARCARDEPTPRPVAGRQVECWEAGPPPA